MHLVLVSIGGGGVEVGELAVVLLIPFGALVLLLLGLLSSELSEFVSELSHFGHGIIVLIGVAEGGVAKPNGDGMKSGRVEGVQGVTN